MATLTIRKLREKLPAAGACGHRRIRRGLCALGRLSLGDRVDPDFLAGAGCNNSLGLVTAPDSTSSTRLNPVPRLAELTSKQELLKLDKVSTYPLASKQVTAQGPGLAPAFASGSIPCPTYWLGKVFALW